MKGEYRERPCPTCGFVIPANKKICPSCNVMAGRINKNPKTPGSYKGYIKVKDFKELSKISKKAKK